MWPMANKLKSSKTKPADPEQLKQEKEETVEVKQLLKDERTHKIAGSILLLFAFLFFIAFTSYLFTWGDDQDKFSYRMLLANDIKVQNLLGTFGAFISEVFVRHGFGIASYLICSTFFVIGVNLFFGKKVFSVVKNIKYLILGLPLISVAAAVVFQGKAFPYGGAAGDMMRDWLYQTIGKIGTIAVLSVAVLSYVIWRFNPVFKLPSKKEINADQDTEAEPENISEKVEWKNPAEPVVTTSGNTLKGNGAMVNAVAEEEAPDHGLNIVEKVEEPEPVPEVKQPLVIPEEPAVMKDPVVPVKAAVPSSDLALEIKTVPEKAVEEPVVSAAAKVAAST